MAPIKCLRLGCNFLTASVQLEEAPGVLFYHIWWCLPVEGHVSVFGEGGFNEISNNAMCFFSGEIPDVCKQPSTFEKIESQHKTKTTLNLHENICSCPELTSGKKREGKIELCPELNVLLNDISRTLYYFGVSVVLFVCRLNNFPQLNHTSEDTAFGLGRFKC